MEDKNGNIINNIQESSFYKKIEDKARLTSEGLKKQYGITETPDNPWPQTRYTPLELYPNYKTTGWLPPTMIPPYLSDEKINYGYQDWRGVKLKVKNIDSKSPEMSSHKKFEQGLQIPRNDLNNSPYSTRDMYAIFGDSSVDYFRHGLQVVNGLGSLMDDGKSDLRLSTFKGTPFENNDPVMFGFEIIMDDISSPLLNESIADFLNNYDLISEIASRKLVYEDFKQQFVKFFKTKATVRINEQSLGGMSNMGEGQIPNSENNKQIKQPGKKAYLGYYLKKVAGLQNLIESNTAKTKKYNTNYNEDIITLTFTEDVSLSIGTLAHLYKLLYWSKPNGKGIIPENLLRFNCEIIVSEVRNFKRVVKAIETGDIEILKDNLSRYVYSLRECQFYFNSVPHEDEIDLAAIKTYDNFSVQFDYKYSTVKLERFVPSQNGLGKYVGYDSGAIWKIGNPGARETNTGTQSVVIDRSVPKFYTVQDQNNPTFKDIAKFVIEKPSNSTIQTTFIGESDQVENTPTQESSDNLEDLKQNSTKSSDRLRNLIEDQVIRSTQRELQFAINRRTAILNRTLNKILNAAGVTGVRPPRNIYTDRVGAVGRIFYDVRGEVLNFLGDSLGSQIGGSRNRSF